MAFGETSLLADLADLDLRQLLWNGGSANDADPPSVDKLVTHNLCVAIDVGHCWSRWVAWMVWQTILPWAVRNWLELSVSTWAHLQIHHRRSVDCILAVSSKHYALFSSERVPTRQDMTGRTDRNTSQKWGKVGYTASRIGAISWCFVIFIASTWWHLISTGCLSDVQASITSPK